MERSCIIINLTELLEFEKYSEVISLFLTFQYFHKTDSNLMNINNAQILLKNIECRYVISNETLTSLKLKICEVRVVSEGNNHLRGLL